MYFIGIYEYVCQIKTFRVPLFGASDQVGRGVSYPADIDVLFHLIGECIG